MVLGLLKNQFKISPSTLYEDYLSWMNSVFMVRFDYESNLHSLFLKVELNLNPNTMKLIGLQNELKLQFQLNLNWPFYLEFFQSSM